MADEKYLAVDKVAILKRKVASNIKINGLNRPIQRYFKNTYIK